MTICLAAAGAPTAAALTPDDPSYPLQWADGNTGQSIPSQDPTKEEKLGPAQPGTPGADERTAQAWRVSTGSRRIVVAELDTGVDYEHPDLAANVWANPGGVGGCAAGTHGYDAVNAAKRCAPMDEDPEYAGHGTHVAGILGAVGDNGVGVAGVAWQTAILPVRWLESASWGEPSALVRALRWIVKAKEEGVDIRVVNDSPVFAESSPPPEELKEELKDLDAKGILFVTAAGNSGENDDEASSGRYVCRYHLPNELCVTASDAHDGLPGWANYGPHTVDLAAPGVSIYSTLREGRYGYLSGGSMAAAQVAGAAALILSGEPGLTPEQLRARLIESARPVPALSGRVAAGGVLDVCRALPGCEAAAPAPVAPPQPAGPPAPVSQPPSAPARACAIVRSRSLALQRSGVVALELAIAPPFAGCDGTLTLRSARALSVGSRRPARRLTLASGGFSITRTTTIRLHLTRSGRQALARMHRLRVRLTLVCRAPSGVRVTVHATLTLRVNRALGR